MKKVLVISAVFPPEPVVSANLSFDIANALSEIKQVTVLSPKPSRPFGFKFSLLESKFKFKHIQTNSYTCPQSSLIGRFKESYSFGKQSYKYINENNNNIDFIYANTWPLMAQFYTVKAAKKNNIPVIIHVQDIYPESLTNKIPLIGPLLSFILKPLDNYILKNATKIIAISEKMKKYIVSTREINTDKVIVINNWQDEESFTQFRKLKNLKPNNTKVFTFMYMGNIGPVAGIETLIDAFTNAKLTNSRLIIAGSGSMKESLEKKTEKFKDNIIEFWDVPNGKVPEIQDSADVLLLPVKKGASLSSIPSKLPSYMFSKKPIIASVDEDSDTANCIKESGSGYVTEPENSVELSKKMVTIAALSAEELNQLGENGLIFAQKNMSKTANLEKVISVIEGSCEVCIKN